MSVAYLIDDFTEELLTDDDDQLLYTEGPGFRTVRIEVTEA